MGDSIKGKGMIQVIFATHRHGQWRFSSLLDLHHIRSCLQQNFFWENLTGQLFFITILKIMCFLYLLDSMLQ
jgi:hypothetical protein